MKPLPAPKKKTLSAYLLLLVGVIACMFMLKKCSSDSPTVPSQYDLASGDTLNVAIEYSPMSMYTFADTLGGFNYDLLRVISSQYGIVMKFHPLVSREEGLAGLADSTFDLLVADIPATLGQQREFRYSEPVFLDRQVLVQSKDSLGKVEVSSVLDLAGRTVWVVKGSPMATRIANLSEEIGDTIYIREYESTSSEQLFILTAIGDVDMCVVNEHTAHALVGKYDNIDVSTKVSFTQFQSWLMRADFHLADSIDSLIDDIKLTEGYHHLYNRYIK